MPPVVQSNGMGAEAGSDGAAPPGRQDFVQRLAGARTAFEEDLIARVNKKDYFTAQLFKNLEAKLPFLRRPLESTQQVASESPPPAVHTNGEAKTNGHSHDEPEGPGRPAWSAEFDGRPVEIHGVDGTRQSEEESIVLDPNGKRGLAEAAEDGFYFVHTYDGYCFSIDEAQLREAEPLEAEMGGFDVAWPRNPSSSSTATFTRSATQALLRKGHCLVEMADSPAVLADLADTARGRPGYGTLRLECEGAYLGRVDVGHKTLWLQRDAEESTVGIAPVAEVLGAVTMGRLVPTRALLRAPLSGSRQDMQLERWVLSETDVRSGLVEAHLDFVQRRCLCLLRPMGSKGGTVELFARDQEAPEEGEPASMQVPVPRGKLLIFCHDLLDYSYQPAGHDDLVLQAWLLEEPQRLLLDTLVGDQRGMEAIFGGPPQAPKDQVHIASSMCRFPGNARHLDRDWLVFLAGTDLHIEVPLSRFDIGLYFDPAGGQFASAGKTIIKHSAFLLEEDLTCFDNQFFGIQDSVAALMPPAQRVSLEVSFEGLAMAGYTRKSLRGTRMMIVVGEGVSGLDWDWKPGLSSDPDAWLQANPTPGLSTGNRLAHIYGTTGPVMMVDSACSSELVAANYIHAILRRHDEKDDMKVGLAMAAQAIITPWPFIGGSNAGLHGDLGRCATFNASANGFVRGEGSCGLVLSGREDPEVIQERLASYVSSFINQDGRSATLTAPNGMSQAQCIAASMRDSGLQPTDICFSECHGTATAIGDPIEVGSLVRVFAKHERALAVTAGKSNVGHTEPVAGGYSLLRVIATVVHGCIPPNVHFRVLSKNVHSFSLSGGNFPGFFPSEVVDELFSNYSIGGVTSFGYGGTNARAEIWAPGRRVREPIELANRGLRGLRIDRFGASTSKFPRELENLDCITVACPSCLGPMCWLCAMAVPSSRGGGRHSCHTVREESASYEVCSDCYTGRYSYGAVVGEPLDPEQRVFMKGTWSAWSAVEEMDEVSPGTYTGYIVLGETRTEQFHLVLEKSKDRAIYPVTSKADQTARIMGPHENLEWQHWLIDGFQDHTAAGTIYQVRFEWGTVRKSISWKVVELGEYMRAMLTADGYEHSYSVARRQNDWKPEKMQRAADDADFWEWTGTISSTGEEEFNFLRDADPTQMIYPLQPRSAGPDCPVMGPDEFGEGNGWLVSGKEGETVTARLRVHDGSITVNLSAGGSRRKTWQSTRRPPGERYFVVGSWNGWRPESMQMDADAPEIHRLSFRVGSAGRGEFQISTNESQSMRMYPATNHARPGQEVCCGGENPDGLMWEVVGPPGQMMEIRLDLGAEDIRETVTCGLVL